MGTEVEEIKSRLSIVDVVGEYVRLTKAGASWKAPCPFHNEKTPSFFVSEERQSWHCFGCNKGGDVFSFVMEMDGMEFREALALLAEKAGVKLMQTQEQAFATDRKQVFREILNLTVRFFEKQLWDGVGKKTTLPYLRERGLTDDSIRQFRLGYAPEGWRNLFDFLSKKGYRSDDIRDAGLAIRSEKTSGGHYDRFRDRIMFPIFDSLGNPVGFSARVAPGGDEKQAKYINTPETALYRKSKVLYGIDLAKRAIKDRDSVLLVEGNMDVIACHQAGIQNTVAVSGTALTADHIAIIRRYTDNMKLFFDMDEAGRVATKKGILLAFDEGVNVDIVSVTDGKDAADVVRKDPATLLTAIGESKSAMEFFFSNVAKQYNANKGSEKKVAVDELSAAISHLQNSVERHHWSKELSRRFGIDEKIVYDVVREKVQSRTVTKGESKGSSVTRISKNREESLREKISSILLSNGTLWRECAEESNQLCSELREQDDLLGYMLRTGSEASFQFDQFSASVPMALQQDVNRIAHLHEKIENGEVIGLGDVEAKTILSDYLEELGRESLRKKLKLLDRDIRRAEQEKDKEALTLLTKEFVSISKKLRDSEQ